jgi:hypothetical protein
MSFNLTRNHTCTNTNVMSDYKTVAEAFCLEYYTLYDDNVAKLKNMYHSDAKFIYLDHEFTGFDNWFNTLKSNNFNRFLHMDMNVNVIPVNDLNILITIVGGVRLNNNIKEHKFTENILLQKENNCNNFYICTTMFKIIE